MHMDEYITYKIQKGHSLSFSFNQSLYGNGLEVVVKYFLYSLVALDKSDLSQADHPEGRKLWKRCVPTKNSISNF